MWSLCHLCLRTFRRSYGNSRVTNRESFNISEAKLPRTHSEAGAWESGVAPCFWPSSIFDILILNEHSYDVFEDSIRSERRKKMDLETSLYAFAWIAGFIIFALRFGNLYR